MEPPCLDLVEQQNSRVQKHSESASKASGVWDPLEVKQRIPENPKSSIQSIQVLFDLPLLALLEAWNLLFLCEGIHYLQAGKVFGSGLTTAFKSIQKPASIACRALWKGLSRIPASVRASRTSGFATTLGGLRVRPHRGGVPAQSAKPCTSPRGRPQTGGIWTD